ncbi:hypothetical protein [Neptunicella sp. SCSIO 80796]|uniref:hypothetical protein n=1 Tax=Neptunicella plasticusilytica TaxID=3117012 RepID=UPI003A4D729E
MSNRLLLIILLLPFNCLADSQFWDTGIDWLKANLADDADVVFQRAEFQYDGLADQTASLDVKHIIGERFFVYTSLLMHRQKLQSGVCKQNIATSEYEIMPQFQLQNDFAVGVGIRRTIESEMSFSQDHQIQLENKSQWFVSLSLNPQTMSAQYGVRYSSTSLDAHDYSPLRQNTTFTDNALTLYYQASF